MRPVEDPSQGRVSDATGRANRAAAIAEAATAFHEAIFDLDVLLHVVAERISRATGDYCSVALVSPDGRRLQPLVAYHPDPRLVEESREFLGVAMDIDASGVWVPVLKNRRSAVLQVDPDHLPPGMAPHQVLHIKRWRIREAALIPLVAGDSVVGGLNLNRLEGNAPFTPTDIELLERLGRQAARAIANARLIQQEKHSAADLQEQVRAQTQEAEARALEARTAVARLQAALNTPLSTIVMTTGPDGTISMFNSGAERLLGYSAGEVVGVMTPAAFLSTANLRIAATSEPLDFSTLARTHVGAGETDEFVLVTRRGDRRPVELSISAIAGDVGGLVGFVMVARDISERKTLETELNAALAEGREAVMPADAKRNEVAELARSLAGWEHFSRERLQGAQAMAELGELTLVEDVTTVGLARLSEIFGASQAWLLLADEEGMRVGSVLDAEDAPAPIRVGARLDLSMTPAVALHAGTPLIGEADSEPWPDCVRRWAERTGTRHALAFPLVSGARAVGIVTLLRKQDVAPFTAGEAGLAMTISAPIAAALEVSRLIAQLRQASRAKSDFLAKMSHEIRTPLNAILGFAELMIDDTQQEFGADQQKKFLRAIHSSGRHLLGLVNDILDLSKIEAGRMELDLKSIDADDAIAEVISTAQPLAGKKQILLTSDPAPAGTLIADPGKLQQMLLNLVSNAIKFTPDGGAVTIRTRRLPGALEISVADTGVGIAESDLETMFEEFKQFGASDRGSTPGTGLGLALTRQFARLHEGDVHVQSQVGKGSEFTLKLPLGGPPHVDVPAIAAVASDAREPD